MRELVDFFQYYICLPSVFRLQPVSNLELQSDGVAYENAKNIKQENQQQHNIKISMFELQKT